MAEFKLPSGRVVEIHEPTFGEDLRQIENQVYANLALIAPGMTREELASLDRADGEALLKEMGRILRHDIDAH